MALVHVSQNNTKLKKQRNWDERLMVAREGRGIPCLYNNVPSSLNSKPVVPIYYFRRGGGGSGSNKYFNISSRSFKMHTAHTVLGMRGISRMKSLYFFSPQPPTTRSSMIFVIGFPRWSIYVYEHTSPPTPEVLLTLKMKTNGTFERAAFDSWVWVTSKVVCGSQVKNIHAFRCVNWFRESCFERGVSPFLLLKWHLKNRNGSFTKLFAEFML